MARLTTVAGVFTPDEKKLKELKDEYEMSVFGRAPRKTGNMLRNANVRTSAKIARSGKGVKLKAAKTKRANDSLFDNAATSVYGKLHQLYVATSASQSVLNGFNGLYSKVGSALSNAAYSDQVPSQIAALLRTPNLDTFVDAASYALREFPNADANPVEALDFEMGICARIGMGSNHVIRKSKSGWLLLHTPVRYGDDKINWLGLGTGEVSSYAQASLQSTLRSLHSRHSNHLKLDNSQSQFVKSFGDAMLDIGKAFQTEAKAYIADVMANPKASEPSAGIKEIKRYIALDAKVSDFLPRHAGLAALVSNLPQVTGLLSKTFKFPAWAIPRIVLTLFKGQSQRALQRAIINRRNLGVNPNYTPADTDMDPEEIGLQPLLFSFGQVLREDLAEYISQSPGEAQPSMSALNTWASAFCTLWFGRGDARDLPEYVIPYNKIAETVKEITASAESRSRTNADGLMIDGSGNVMWVPETDSNLVNEYQALLDETARICFKLGSPFSINHLNIDDAYMLDADPDTLNRQRELKVKLRKFSSVPLAAYWGVNALLTTGAENAASTSSIHLGSGIALDNRSTYDMLGQQSLLELLGYVGTHDGKADLSIYNVWSRNHTLMHALKLHAVLVKLKRATSLDVLMRNSLKRTVTIDPQANGLFPKDGIHDRLSILQTQLDSDGSFKASTVELQSRVLLSMVDEVYLRETVGDEFVKLQKRDPLLNLSPNPSSLYEMQQYAAVDVLLKAMKEVDAAIKTPEDVKEIAFNSDTSETFMSYAMVSSAKALCTMLTKYAEPAAFKLIKEHADKVRESGLVKDSDVFRTMDEAEQQVPAIADAVNAALFPHQIRTLNITKRTADELFALDPNALSTSIVDAAPGSGKTIMLLMDAIRFMMGGRIKKPVISPPNNLGGNWQEDLAKISDGRYNCIVLTSNVMNRWKRERVATSLRNAPPNTIVIATQEFLKNQNAEQLLVLGTSVVETFPNVQMLINEFKPDYLGIDESHKVKNDNSDKFGGIEALVGAPTLRVLRLASGTVVTDKLTDLIGQTRLINPYIFRSKSRFEEKYKDKDGRSWVDGAAGAIRERLQDFSTLVTVRRREFGFMLPFPKEQLHTVPMPEEYKDLHDAILNESLEHLKFGSPRQRDVYRWLTDGDESKGEAIEAALGPYIARLEQFLLAPNADPMAKQSGKTLPVSPKIVDPDKGLIKLIREHMALPDTIASPGKNKILIFTKYKNSARAVFDALPPDLKKIAAYYDASHKEGLSAFYAYKPEHVEKTGDVRILCAVEDSINTGKNLQMASRLIRLTLPWSPGDLDQALSRIMRPTPPRRGADGKFIEHDLQRDFIYLDTILMAGSMELVKFARLTSKIVSKTLFDEHGNPDYEDLPEVEPLRMSIANFQHFRSLKDIGLSADGKTAEPGSYLDAYQQFKQIEQDTFVKMRSTQLSQMVAVPEAPALEGSKTLPLGLLPTINEEGRAIKPPAGDYDRLMSLVLKGKKVKDLKPGKKKVKDEEDEPQSVELTPKGPKKNLKDVTEKPGVTKKEDVTPSVAVDVTNFNGVYSVAVTDDQEFADAAMFKALGFKHHGPKVYTLINNRKQLEQAYAALRDKYALRRDDCTAIETFLESFVGRKAVIPRAQMKDIRNYLLETQHPLTNGPNAKKLRLYCVLYDGGDLYLVTDYKTQRAAQDLLRRRRLPGSTSTWTLESGSWAWLGLSKAQVIEQLKKLEAKIVISNKMEIKEVLKMFKR